MPDYTLWQLAANYGQPNTHDDDGNVIGTPTSRYGVLSEHLHLCEDNPNVIVRHTANWTWVCAVESELDDAMEAAVPVVCSELIPITTEDGPDVGRCGQPAVGYGCCAGHSPELV